MTSDAGANLPVLAVTLAVGSVVIGVVLVAIATLVVVLWRRAAGSGEVTHPVASGPRPDSHAVTPSVAAPERPVEQPSRPAEEPSARLRGTAEGPNAARAPHPSGLGAAELAAIVEEGLASLRMDLDTIAGIIDSVGAASAVPEDLPARPAVQQVVLIDQMTAVIAPDLDRAQRLAAAMATDIDRGHEARGVVHGELIRIGLPAGFFVTMDATAADLAVDLVRAQMAVERLVRRFEALSSLYSSVRPIVGLLDDLGGVLGRAAAVANPWRQAPGTVDLVQRHVARQMLPG